MFKSHNSKSFFSKFGANYLIFSAILLCLLISAKILSIYGYFPADISNFNSFVGVGDAYFAMLSLVFVVTSIVTVLSDKSETIFWTGVMEYKLVNPKYFNLVSQFAYLISCVTIATVAIVIYSPFVYICVIIVTILLSIISCRMLSGFFFRNQITNELTKQFMIGKVAYSIYKSFEQAEYYAQKDNISETRNRLWSIFYYIKTAGNEKSEKKLNYNQSASALCTACLDCDEQMIQDLITSPIVHSYIKVLCDIKSSLFDADGNFLFKGLPALPSEISNYLSDDKIKSYFQNEASEEQDEELLEMRNSWNSSVKDSYAQNKAQLLSIISDLMENFKPYFETWTEQKDKLISLSVEYLNNGDIKHVTENAQLLLSCKREINAKELLDYAVDVNSTVYTHIVPCLKNNGHALSIIDFDSNSICGWSNKTLRNKCILNIGESSNCLYLYNQLALKVIKIIDEYEQIVMSYSNDIDTRIHINESLKRINDRFFEALLPINELLIDLCFCKNMDTFIEVLRLISCNSLKNQSSLLSSTEDYFFGGTIRSARFPMLSFDAKMKKLSWFIPSFSEEINQQLIKMSKSGELTSYQASLIVEYSTEAKAKGSYCNYSLTETDEPS